MDADVIAPGKLASLFAAHPVPAVAAMPVLAW